MRELKARLSEYLAHAARGEDVVVTDRGRPIARLVPFSGDSAVQLGIDEGWIEPPRRRGLVRVPRVRALRSVNEVLEEDRA